MSLGVMTVLRCPGLEHDKPASLEGAPLTVPGLMGGDSSGQRVLLWLLFCLLWGNAPVLSTKRSIMY